MTFVRNVNSANGCVYPLRIIRLVKPGSQEALSPVRRNLHIIGSERFLPANHD
jgi:hypothetical protein